MIIVGAGPTGLAFAHYATKQNKKVLILEKEDTLGGCHRVHRVDTMFTEHGPRVYSNAFINFIEILEDMGTSLDELFTPYNFNFNSVVSATKLKPMEILQILGEFLMLSINPDHGKTTSVLKFAQKNKFSESTIEYLDALCRLTDGATADKYTLYQFLNLIDQQALYNLYQPKQPNDVGLFNIWGKYLLKQGVVIKTGVDVYINTNGNVVTSVNEHYIADDYILAIPPISLVGLLKTSSIPDAFGNELTEYSKDTEYIDYISVTYHFDTTLQLPKIWGFPKNDWGVGFIILTDYMTFDNNGSKTVISAVITKANNPSKTTGKTAKSSNSDEIITELYRQLELDIPKPTTAIVYPLQEEAYISNVYSDRYTIPFRSNDFTNLYSVGTHSKKSEYQFTTIESAVTNARYLANKMYSTPYPRRNLITVTKILGVVYIIIILVVLIGYR